MFILQALRHTSLIILTNASGLFVSGYIILFYLDTHPLVNKQLKVFCTYKSSGKILPFTSSTHPAFTCSKLTIETVEQGVKHVQS